RTSSWTRATRWRRPCAWPRPWPTTCWPSHMSGRSRWASTSRAYRSARRRSTRPRPCSRGCARGWGGERGYDRDRPGELTTAPSCTSKQLPRPRRQAPRHGGELLSAGQLGLAKPRRQPTSDGRNEGGTSRGKHGVHVGSNDPGARKHVADHRVDVVELGRDPFSERGARGPGGEVELWL